MDAIMRIKLKPYKGRYCSRRVANKVNDFFMSLPTPDETKLQEEANDFKKIILERRRKASVKKL